MAPGRGPPEKPKVVILNAVKNLFFVGSRSLIESSVGYASVGYASVGYASVGYASVGYASVGYAQDRQDKQDRLFCFGKRTQNQWRPGVAPKKNRRLSF